MQKNNKFIFVCLGQYLKKYGGEDSSFHHGLKFHLKVLRDSNTEDEIE